MKKFVGAVLFTAILLLCLWYYTQHGRKPFRCDTQQISVLVKAQTDIVLNANSTVIFSSAQNGIVYLIGSVKENDTRYLLDRKIFFTLTPSELEGASNTQLTHEEVHPADSTPDRIWQNFLLPEVQRVNFYTQIIPLFHNALLIKGVSNPFLVCIRQG